MGDHEGWVGQSSGLRPNGLLPNGAANATRVLDAERWGKAEERTAELIACIQPNQPSEQRRNAVANYVRQLIMKCFSCQVFTYGSVPLKTYLPDGDIDLTAFSKNESLKDTWALEVRDILENEEKSENAEFRVKEVQYIQAEVKIVKCLVENIVVDISFNQVGGLCTLCFLEEIDHLINQNHLFKRSIILIKAWCYYESRILGAHHGLLSTYALETLVLYIFHVFNNSFSGPLEVLYRFLEFFSNFDWESFCVSLCGPVPISSLPDITAHPPRKDGGELLLSQPFLSACSTIYAVMQPGQEIQNQPFVSKHFNVIDPLRTNNNLGRSVSKGNFFRIRSAFAFGAKKLAVLLECPKEKLIPELNQFFMNTWERHGSGGRPDAPVSNLLTMQSFKTIQLEEETDSKNTVNKNNSKNISHVHWLEASATAIPNNIDQHSCNIYGTSNEAAISHTQSLKNYGSRSNSKASNPPDRNTRNTSSSGSVISNKNEKYFRSDYSVNGHEVRGRFQFARTRSSPELTDASATVTSQGKHNKFVEISKGQTMLPRADQVIQRKNFNSEVSGSHSSVSDFDDPASTRQSSFCQPLENAAGLNTVSSSITDDTGFTSTWEEPDLVSAKLETQQEMHQEDQDAVHMMSSGVHNFKGQVQLPMHFASPQLHIPLPPFLASIGYAHRNMIGMVPANIPLVEPSWGSSMQFPQAHVPSTSSSLVHTGDQILNADDVNESGNLGFGLTRVNLEVHEHDTASPRAFDLDNGGFHKPHNDENHQLISDNFSFTSSLRASNSGAALLRGQHKFSGETRSLVTEDCNDGIGYQSSRVDGIYSSEKAKNMRPLTMSQSGSSRSKCASDGLRDRPNGRVSKSRDKSGSNPASSSGMTSLYGKTMSGQQCNGSSYPVSAEKDDDRWVRFPSSMISNDMNERTSESTTVTSHAGTYQLSEYEFVQLKGSNSMFPIGPVLIGGSHNGAENPQVVPLTFFPTGPPVPFLTMLPVCNYQSDTRTSDGSTNQFGRNKGEDHDHIDPSDQNLDSVDSADQSEARLTSIVSSNMVPAGPSEGRKSDILNSDFSSHWQNLQFGRSCQNTHAHGSMIYPSPVMVPPVYLQGHFPLEAPGRPLATNANLYAQLMSYGPRFIPVTPLQQGPARPPAGFNRFADGPPRFRGGTGTYLPSPGSFRDRQSPATRHHRGNNNHERSDLADREGSWIAAKQRAVARNHGFRQAEKQSSRLDQFSSSENRSEKPRDSHSGRGSAASSESQSIYFRSRNSTQNAANPNGPAPSTSVPSVVMFYPFGQGATDGSPAESLEFGSLGPVHLPSMTETPQPNNSSSVREVLDRRHTTYRAGSPCSSPDNPSSPLVQR